MTMYRLLLLLLPRSFREEFGPEMAAVFADQRSRSGRSLAFWIETAWSVIALSIRLRVDQTRTDLRHAFRSLLRQKTFTFTAVATLALALGPATAVFSLVDGILFTPVPGVRALDRVVYAWTANPERNRREFPWSELNFIDHRARAQGFSALGASTSTTATIGGDVPQQVEGAWVSEDMFPVLGIDVAQGRRFAPSDMLAGAAPVLILGHDYAASRFPGRSAVGESLMVDGRPTAIVGVLPQGFEFPAGAKFWQPLVVDRATSNRAQTYLRVMGRLQDGRTIQEAEQQMNAVAADLEKQFPASNAGYRVNVVSATSFLTRSARRTVSVLALAAAAILLLSCTNIASLLVVRIAGRQPELSLRTALGASAARLSRQLLIEHLLLAAAAAAAAITVSYALLELLALTRLVPAHQIARAVIGPKALLFLVALTTAIAVTLGWMVSRRATRTAVASSTLRTHSATKESVRLRQILVSVEMGAAVVLLLAAALLLQSASRLMQVDPGFRTENVITFQVGLPISRYPQVSERMRFIDGVVEKLSQLPGVTAAASGAYGPMSTTRATRRFAVDGTPLPAPGAEPIAIDLPASPGYASLMGLRVVDGRWISARDTTSAPPVVVISESFARQYFPGERAVGRRLRYYGSSQPGAPPPPTPEIIGVVSDVRQFAMAEPEAPQMYVPHAQRAWTFTSFFVRTASEPRSVIGSLPAAVHALDPERPLEKVQTLEERVNSSTADRRALSALLMIAAIVAVLISTIGVYGVTAATTSARRRELAIRAAAGADRLGLLNLVVRQGLAAAAIGIAIGVGVGLAAASVLEAVLYEVAPRDPATMAMVAVGLLLVSAVACYLPARRAVAINPATALNEP